MTVTTHTLATHGPTDLLGRRVAARLSEGTQQLPHEVSERLRAARVRAVANRKLEVAAPLRGYALGCSQRPLRILRCTPTRSPRSQTVGCSAGSCRLATACCGGRGSVLLLWASVA